VAREMKADLLAGQISKGNSLCVKVTYWWCCDVYTHDRH